MIKTFADKSTKAFFERNKAPKRIPHELLKTARRKIDQIELVERLEELNVPPGNRLEALKGDRKGQHSIRINNQWRICFHWAKGNAYDVEIVDYH